MKIGCYIIIKASELPHYQKAHELARLLTENDLDLILTGKMHLHGNPVRKQKAAVQSLGPVEIVTGERPRKAGMTS